MAAVCDLLSYFVLYKHTKIGQNYNFFLNCANKKCFILCFLTKIKQKVLKNEEKVVPLSQKFNNL